MAITHIFDSIYIIIIIIITFKQRESEERELSFELDFECGFIITHRPSILKDVYDAVFC